MDGLILVQRESECSGSALYGGRGEEDLFTSLGEQAPHLLSAQQCTAEAQMRDENRLSICEVE